MVIFQKHDTKTMNIAVYTGSFNPMHIGHLSVLRYLLDEGGYDMVYLIVSPQNPFKDSSLADSGEKRYEAACRSVEEHGFGSRVKVDDIEFALGTPSYTIRTLDALKQREKDNEFTLVIGADNLDNIHLWKNSERILLDYGVAVYPRKGFDLTGLREALLEENPLYRIRVIDAPEVNVSSTMIRRLREEGKDVSAYLM